MLGSGWGDVSRPTSGGILGGLAGGESPGSHLGGCWGPGWGDVSRPTPGGMLGVWLGGCVQAHTWDIIKAHTGGFRPTPGGHIPACTEAATSLPLSQHTATAAGSTHPTGMHSCGTFFCF